MATRFTLGDGPDRGKNRDDVRVREVPATMVAAQHQVTGDVIDEAVEGVFREREVDAATASVFRNLMASDPNTGFAQAYYQSRAAAGLSRSHLAAVKKKMVIPYLVDDKQAALLTAYVPEYSLEFRGVDMHDHPLAAASRMLDQSLVESKNPPGAKVADVGGSPEHHAKAGGGVHICQPIVDPKDPARAVQREMRLKNLAVQAVHPATREYARAYLAGDPVVVCGQVAQKCEFKASVINCVHVYDIPMGDWPLIIENKGARLVEGCMLFSPRVMESVRGEFPQAGARYEVDVAKDKFRMGFVGSPSWWYEHSWLEYCKYGVDQILYGTKCAYSYKITERRGDTIFFRILPVSRSVPRNIHQVYRLPDVQMVEVQGFDLATLKKPSFVGPVRKVWHWPLPLWIDMMRHATEMLERGTLSHERLYNHYRTVAPRQTINATLVAGGYTVELEQLVPLIVHVSLAAAASVFGSQAASRQIIGAELRERKFRDELTVSKVVMAFAEGLKASFSLVLFPLAKLGEVVSRKALDTLRANVLDWAPRAVCRPMNAKFFVMDVDGFQAGDYSVDDVDFIDEVSRAAPFDHVTAAMNDPKLASVILEMFSSVLPERVVEDLQVVVQKDKDKEKESQADVQRPVEKAYSEGSGTLVSGVKSGGAKAKRDAILEAIAESEAEQKKIQSACALAYLELCSGNPSLSTLRKRVEEFRNPDFWWVEAGVIVKSVLGVPVEDFTHAAVFTPVSNPGSDSLLRPVYTSEYEGFSQGKRVERTHMVLADKGFTGWVFVNDTLNVYNGPEIVSAMRKALDCSLDFSVTLMQGPPGCGKTTQIVENYQQHCVVLCPARESTDETRGRLLKKFGRIVDFKNVVRTVDSYLVNYFTSKKIQSLAPTVLLADEGFMARSGKWYSAAALLGVEEIRAFGDAYQIPHVPRAEVSKLHIEIVPDVVKYEWRTFRCPADAVAAWGHIYDWRVRSVSGVETSMQHVATHRGLQIPDGCVMMGCYQADKKELRQVYSNCGVRVKIMTVHESQGKTFEHVWLHRFDRRKRTDNFSLYDKPAYMLVAASRHTKSFKYICPDLDDPLSKWIKQSKDVRRVRAAGDVESLGVSKEFM